MAKRGAHAPEFLLKAGDGFESFEKVYGAENLTVTEDWLMSNNGDTEAVGVRIITAAPEIEGVRPAVEEAVKRGVVFSIGHRLVSVGDKMNGIIHAHLVSLRRILRLLL